MKKDGTWDLRGVERTDWPTPNDAVRGTALTLATLPHLAWPTSLNAGVVASALLPVQTMSTLDLWRYTSHLADQDQAVQRHEIQFWKKALYPLACVVMVALALPFAYLHARAGSVSFKVAGAVVGSNLDVALQIIDGNGTVLASANTVNVLSGAISVNLPAQGTYFLSVTGAGNGDPLKTGYSNYGSLGQYSISGTSALANNTSAVASIKTSATRGTGPLTISLDASASALVGGKINSYQWTFGDGTPIATTALVKHTYTKAGIYEAVLKIIDSRGASTVTGVKITVS